MSYEREMLEMLAMPAKQEIKEAIIKTLFRHNGSIKEFASGQIIVDEIADQFSLSKEQREEELKRIYKKENRVVKTPLWHRLLYRAANELAKERYVTRPSDTILLTDKKEWLLTEKGIDYALKLLNIPLTRKEMFSTQSFEIHKEINRIKEQPRPEQYTPFEQKTRTYTKMVNIRSRSFRQAVVESYNYACSVCGLKLNSPDNLHWEIEAAHIVPHGLNGKDDIWNGIALCGLHHWAFDVGWFSISNNYQILISSHLNNIPQNFGNIGKFEFFKDSLKSKKEISLPDKYSFRPHESSLMWHREHIFYP
jgi:hypothetical protein